MRETVRRAGMSGVAVASTESTRMVLGQLLRSAESHAGVLRAAQAVLKRAYLLRTRSRLESKRTELEREGMAEAAAAMVGSVGLMLKSTAQATKVRAAKVWTARVTGSKVLC